MKTSKSIRQFKKEITKNFTKYSNKELILMLKEGKRDEVINSLLPLVIYVQINSVTIMNLKNLYLLGILVC